MTPVKSEAAIVFTGHFYIFYQFFIDFRYFLRRAEPFLGGDISTRINEYSGWMLIGSIGRDLHYRERNPKRICDTRVLPVAIAQHRRLHAALMAAPILGGWNSIFEYYF